MASQIGGKATEVVSPQRDRPNAFWDQSGGELKIGSSPLSLRQFCFYWRSLSLACRHFFVNLWCIVFKEPWVFAIAIEHWMDLSPNLSTGELVFVSQVETLQWNFLCWWCCSHRCSLFTQRRSNCILAREVVAIAGILGSSLWSLSYIGVVGAATGSAPTSTTLFLKMQGALQSLIWPNSNKIRVVCNAR